MRIFTLAFACLALAAACVPARSMPVVWVRMTGQYPVECSPVVADVSGDGAAEIVAVNRKGQVMVWALDGKAVGAGQDGAIAQLPDGRWTSTPVISRSAGSVRIVLCSVEGTVIALDARDHRVVWKQSLAGETNWGRGLPAALADGSLCYGDKSGVLTCLAPDGGVKWQVKTGAGPCLAQVQAHTIGGQEVLLASFGNQLICCDAAGRERWRRDLGGAILSRAEPVTLGGRSLILCAAGSGALAALDEAGAVVWRTELGAEIDTSIVLMPRPGRDPIILCAGVWGNVYGLEPDGKLAWTHLLHTKGRARPLITDANGDGRLEALIPMYDQRMYAFTADGDMVDAVFANGLITSSAVPVEDPATPGRTDVLVMTGSLCLYRYRAGAPEALHGAGASAAGVGLEPRGPAADGGHVLVVRNPGAALLTSNVRVAGADGRLQIAGAISSRTLVEIPLPRAAGAGLAHCRATVRAGGSVVQDLVWDARLETAAKPAAPGGLRAWSAPAHGLFSDRRLAPEPWECPAGREREVTVSTLYRGEVGAGAIEIASTLDGPVRVRVNVEQPLRADGRAFGGSVTLRQCVFVPTINGEQAADALPTVPDSGVITVMPGRTARLWISAAAASSAQAGKYASRILVTPLDGGLERIEMSLAIEVLPLELPRTPALRLCSWDYVPNTMFPSWTTDALDDMTRHGISVFPRTGCIPTATAAADGRVTMDWSKLDAELDRLKGRGVVLLQIGVPEVKFEREPAADVRHEAELAYLRALRDHLRQRGMGYADYAFYPVDEPGLGFGGSVNELVRAGNLIREADPRLRIYTDPVPAISWVDFERIEKLIDVWSPNMRLVTAVAAKDPRMERILKSGKTVWSYECVGQVKSLSPLRYNRANAWRAMRFGLTGIGIWTHSMTPTDPWQRNDRVKDEWALVYPGDRPVPSVRYEAVREGIQDAGAVALLRSRIEARRRTGTRRELVAQAEEALRVAIADIAQMSEEAFIESRDFLAQGDRRIWHTWSDIETYARHRARIAELTIALGD